MFDGRWRSKSERALRPIGASLRRTGVAADHLTAAGLGFAGVAAVLIGGGALRWGAAMLLCASLTDVLDGAVAKASGTATSRGAFFDSVADRVTDALLLGGVAWYLLDTDGGHIVVLPMAALGLSFVISYERAKAESLGFHAKGGLMERAERLITLGVGLVFGSMLIPVLWVMVLLTAVTAVQRFALVWRQATAAARGIPDVGRWQLGRWRGRRIARPTARAFRRRTRARR